MAERDSTEETVEKLTAIAQIIIKTYVDLKKTEMEREANELKYAPQKAFCEQFGKKDSMIYKLKGNCQDDFEKRLQESRLPYLSIGDGLYCIFNENYNEITTMNRDANILQGKYFQEYNAVEMENVIANANIQDKSIYHIEGLDYYEKTVLQNKCNDITRGFMVGSEERPDGKYNIAIRGSYVYDAKSSHDLCHSMLSASLSLYGSNEIIKKMQIDHDVKMTDLIAHLKGCEKPHYIIGKYDVDNYITIDQTGFTVTNTNLDKDNNRHDNNEIHIDINDPDYERELMRYRDEIMDEQIIDDPRLLQTHIQNNSILNDTLTEARPIKDMNQAEQSYINDRIAKKLDKMIKNKIGEKTPEEGVKKYKQELDKILNSIQSGFVPSLYSKKEFDEIKDIFKSKSINIDKFKDAVRRGFNKEGYLANARSFNDLTIAESRDRETAAFTKEVSKATTAITHEDM